MRPSRRSALPRSSWSPSRCSGRSPSCRRCSRGWATRSTGCTCRSSAASAATTAKVGSGARSSTVSCGARCLGRRRRRAARRARATGAAAPHGLAGSRDVPGALACHQDLQPDAGGVPRDGPCQRRREGAGRECPGRAGGDRGAEAEALASGRMYEPITVAVNRDATVANISVPLAGSAADDEAVAAIATSASRSSRRPSVPSPAPRPVSPELPPAGRTAPTG